MAIKVLILAGGIGLRMHSNVPKQFIEVDGEPIIVRTIRNFEKNDRIDSISIVCVANFVDEMWRIVRRFGLTKIEKIVAGGKTGHDSTRNGVFSLKNSLADDDYLIVHDAVRPLLPQSVLDDLIDTALKRGNACPAVPCYETVICTSDGVSGIRDIDRNSFVRVQTPQMFQYRLIRHLYEMADNDGRHDFVYANTLAIHYGVRIYFSRGFLCNYKITTPSDIPLYKALLCFSEEELARR